MGICIRGQLGIHRRAAGVLKLPLSGRRKGLPMDLCPWWPEAPLASWASRSLPGKAGARATQSQPSGSGDGVGLTEIPVTHNPLGPLEMYGIDSVGR